MILACVLACSFAALLPLGYSGLGLAHPGLLPAAYGAAPYAAVPATYSAAAFPSYETVSHTVDVTHEPVEQHGYIVKY